MNRNLWIGTLAALLVNLLPTAGTCRAENPPAAAPATAPQVGLVDLDKVATDMGWMAQMKDNLTQLQSQFRGELGQVQSAQEAKIQQRKTELGLKETDSGEEIMRKLTPPQQQELVQMMNGARQQLFQLQQSANQQFQGYEANWIKNYREAVAPAVRKVAQDKKILLVLSQAAGTVLYADTTIDLTQPVITELKATPPVLQPLPFPKLLAPAGATTQPATQPAAPR